MKKKKNYGQTKRCPRCNEKCVFSQPTCPECGLVFSRLANTSNKVGKKAAIKSQKNLYFMCSLWPDDVKRWKALLWCGFLGMFGAHNFYLGRFLKAFFSLIVITLAITASTLLAAWRYYDVLMFFVAIPGAFATIFWIWDFAMICVGKYKIPVGLKEQKD